MILTENRSKVVTGGDIQTSGFTIKASRKAFQILSAGLYSDKVRAIIRELAANAMDAHIAAGKASEPFKMHLPNNMEPWFEVTDYGTGLSDEDILNIYTKYFESNKTDDPNATGCLGLGSKSPFSYTDSFTVESRFNGNKTIYTAFLSEDGMPCISRMASEETSESNGLTVKFPVKSADFYAFKEKAFITLQWFAVRPTITGVTITFPERKYLRQTDKYAVTQERAGRSFVIMGNIAYPIETYEFLGGYDAETTRLKNLVEWGIELYVPLGDVDFVPSREKLGYDKRTVKYLKDSLTAALADLEKEITKEISGMPTIWAARRKLHSIRNSFQGFDFTAEYNGEKINDFVNVGVKDAIASDGKKIELPVASVERLRIKSGRHSTRTVVKKERAEKVYADGSVIFLNDARGAYAAVRRYLADKDDKTVIYLVSDADADWLTTTGVAEAAIKTSTLPKPERGSCGNGPRGSASKAKVFTYVEAGNSDNGSTSASRYWTPAEVDVDEDDGIFVEILYFNFRNSEGEPTQHPQRLERLLEMVEGITGKRPTIYGIRPSDKAMIEEAEGNWTTLHDYLTQLVVSKEPIYAEDEMKADRLSCLTADYYRYRPTASAFEGVKFADHSVFGEYVREFNDAERASRRKGLTKYRELRSYLNIVEASKDTDPDALENLKEKVFTTYPLLAFLSSRSDKDYADAVTEYVKAIDSK